MRARNHRINPTNQPLEPGNPLIAATPGGHYRAAVRHLLPALRLLDGSPCFPHRSRKSEQAADPSDLLSSSYSTLHRPQRKQPSATYGVRRPRYARDTEAEVSRRRASGASTSTGSHLGGASGTAASDNGDDSSSSSSGSPSQPQQQQPPPTQPSGYVPPWRRLPNPLPHGWRDYAGLAAQSLVVGGRLPPPPLPPPS